MILIPSGAFRQRLDWIEKLLAPLGDVSVEDLSTTAGGRSISFVLEAPGYGLPTRAVLEYRERYRRTRAGWLRNLYVYEYRPQPPPSRRAHHDHEPQGVHRHCREARRPEAHRHYEDRPRLLEQTHEEFAAQFIDGVEIRCAGLLPLR